MTKLDNKGWGLGVFLLYLSIFLAAIILVSYIANKNNLGSESTRVNNDNQVFKRYRQYELEVESVARHYQVQNYPTINEGEDIYININRMNVDNEILDRCSGYVKISNNEGTYSYNPYLRCGTYRTNGYSSSLDN